MTYTVAVIGAGAEPENQTSGESFSMGYKHANAYARLDNCELVAVADIIRENAAAFAAEFGLPEDAVFEDHRTMLATAEPDVVSIAVPPSAHAPVTIDCAAAGVEAVHCEKPMADTWGSSVRMATACWRRDVQLTFNHQLRFHDAADQIRELLDQGAIGTLERIEASRGTLFDSGTHQVDLANYFHDDRPVEWVIGQVDYREENRKFGTHNANQALVQWRYEDGVEGLAATGVGEDLVGVHNRLIGTEGRIELNFFGDGPTVRLEQEGGVETFDVPWNNPLEAAVEDVIDALDSDREPTLSARNALNATEIIFGAFESARKRGRVDLPLEIQDNPLEAMVDNESVDFGPE